MVNKGESSLVTFIVMWLFDGLSRSFKVKGHHVV